MSYSSDEDSQGEESYSPPRLDDTACPTVQVVIRETVVGDDGLVNISFEEEEEDVSDNEDTPTAPNGDMCRVIPPHEMQNRRKVIKMATIDSDSIPRGIVRFFFEQEEPLDDLDLRTTEVDFRTVCHKYYDAVKKCTRLEHNRRLLQRMNQELRHKCTAFENQCEVIQTHAKKLQKLINERDKTIEGLKSDLTNEKQKVQDLSQQQMLLQKTNNFLNIRQAVVRDILSGKGPSPAVWLAGEFR